MEQDPIIQSVLFRSPYSGCSRFSGWPREPCKAAPFSSTWPPAKNAPGAILCVDKKRGRKPPAPPGVRVVRFGLGKWQGMVPQQIVRPGALPPRPIQTLAKPAYHIAKGIRGPSATGPYTAYAHYDEKAGAEFSAASLNASGHNQGLS